MFTGLKLPSLSTSAGGSFTTHCCRVSGCFRGGAEFSLALETQSFGWALFKEHKKALICALMERKCEMLVRMVAGFLEQPPFTDSASANVFQSRIRKGLFQETHSLSSELPLCELKLECCTLPLWRAVHSICHTFQKNLPQPDTDMFKVAVVGDNGVGKSTLTQRFITGQFVRECDPFIEETHMKRITFPFAFASGWKASNAVFVDILDTVSTNKFSALRNRWKPQVTVVCADLSGECDVTEKFEEYMRQFAESKGVDYRQFGRHWHDPKPDACVVLVGTKGDRTAGAWRRTQAFGSVTRFSEELDIPYIETSAKYNVNVDLVFRTCVYEYWLRQMYFR